MVTESVIAFKASDETKQIQLNDKDPTHVALICTGMDKKRKARSASSSVRIVTSLLVVLPTCKVFRGSLLSTHLMYTKTLNPSNNSYGDLEMKDDEPYAKKLPGFWQQSL